MKQQKVFEVTKSKVTKWFRVLNKTIFNGELEPFKKIVIRNTNSYYGQCLGFQDMFLETYCHLHINKNFTSISMFLEILAHEMVHQYQWLSEETMNHGKSFMIWSDKLKKYGIRLLKKVPERESTSPCVAKALKRKIRK